MEATLALALRLVLNPLRCLMSAVRRHEVFSSGTSISFLLYPAFSLIQSRCRAAEGHVLRAAAGHEEVATHTASMLMTWASSTKDTGVVAVWVRVSSGGPLHCCKEGRRQAALKHTRSMRDMKRWYQRVAADMGSTMRSVSRVSDQE
jgi:hypothetical protein